MYMKNKQEQLVSQEVQEVFDQMWNYTEEAKEGSSLSDIYPDVVQILIDNHRKILKKLENKLDIMHLKQLIQLQDNPAKQPGIKIPENERKNYARSNKLKILGFASLVCDKYQISLLLDIAFPGNNKNFNKKDKNDFESGFNWVDSITRITIAEQNITSTNIIADQEFANVIKQKRRNLYKKAYMDIASGKSNIKFGLIEKFFNFLRWKTSGIKQKIQMQVKENELKVSSCCLLDFMPYNLELSIDRTSKTSDQILESDTIKPTAIGSPKIQYLQQQSTFAQQKNYQNNINK